MWLWTQKCQWASFRREHVFSHVFSLTTRFHNREYSQQMRHTKINIIVQEPTETWIVYSFKHIYLHISSTINLIWKKKTLCLSEVINCTAHLPVVFGHVYQYTHFTKYSFALFISLHYRVWWSCMNNCISNALITQTPVHYKNNALWTDCLVNTLHCL